MIAIIRYVKSFNRCKMWKRRLLTTNSYISNGALRLKIVFLIILPFMLLLIIGVYAPVFAGTPLMAVVDTGDGSVLAELRDKPSENGKVLGTFYNGVELNVMEQHGGWSSVAILGGIRGFIKTEMLSFEDERFFTRYPNHGSC